MEVIYSPQDVWDESPVINNLALLLFKRRLCFRNWSYNPCLAFLGVGDNDVMDEFILETFV